MPHLRERHIKTLLEKSGKFSPIVSVFGHRQVGKTTLVSLLSKNYTTLDDKNILTLAQEDPEFFLREKAARPLVIDECQLAPPLFPALKEYVRTHPRPGQFILTGSVRFSSRKAIRESLTGRMIAWELLPMDLSEAHSAPLPHSLSRLIDSKNLDIELPAARYFHPKEFDKYLVQGGLPGVFAVHDPGIRRQRFDTQIDTLLERDLRLILETTLSLRSMRNLLTVLAHRQCQPLELAATSRTARISLPTLRKLISAFQAMFLIRLVETEGTEKKPVLFFEDQGEATFLVNNRYDPLTQLTRFLFAQLRVQWAYRPDLEGSIFQFRNRGGAYVPLCFRNKNGVLGVIPILEENPNESALATARSFLKVYSESKVAFVHLGKNDRVLSSRMRILSVGQLV